MALDGLGYSTGMNAQTFDTQAYGAQIATSTQGSMKSVSTSATSQQSIQQMAGSREGMSQKVVSKTLDAMTAKPSSGAASNSYDFNTQMINAVHTGKGSVIDTSG